MRRLQAIDLLCGAGGWAVAARGLPIDFVLALDWDPVCLATYRQNHAWSTVRADVVSAAVDWAALCGRVDLVVGAIPCETISAARRLGPAPAQEVADLHVLLDRCLAIVQAINPRWWVFEDVPPIVDALPPLVPYQVIDAADYSGQARKRAYMGVFPQPRPGHDRRRLADYLRPGPYRLSLRVDGRRAVTNGWAAGTYRPQQAERKALTICRLESRRDVESVVRDGELERQLTWEEAALLQGFPMDYLFRGSPGQVSHQIGQAIQIDCGRAILQAIVNSANGW